MYHCGSVQFSPQISVFYRLLFFGLPAIFFPKRNPFRDSVFYVFRVGEKINFTLLFQCRKRFYRGGYFHAVIRRGNFSPAKLTSMRGIGENSSPTTGAGVPMTPAVRVSDNLFH